MGITRRNQVFINILYAGAGGVSGLRGRDWINSRMNAINESLPKGRARADLVGLGSACLLTHAIRM